MPVRDGVAYLERCVPALVAATAGDLLEVIVVDDGSRDGSGERAAALGARVVRVEACGPAAARNRGVCEARGEAVLFVDADVVIHSDVPTRTRRALAEPGVSAVFGCYDETPPERNFASLYMNLRHRHVHRQGAGDVGTMWTGCGAVRKAALEEVGGFDEARFPGLGMEDVELGKRLHDRGARIRLVPEIECTHLKRWTLASVVRTDLFERAIPWARIIAEGGVSNQLNASLRERACALVAWAWLLSLWLAAVGAASWLWPAALLGLAAWLNRGLLSLWRRAGGAVFAAGALLMHQGYYLYATATFAFCLARHRLGAAPGRS